ncbi:Beta-lactamase superfamily domain-containing protein [Sphingobacterium nematocida]|uniref:Beta-lactamase superfamily domain-containing protein n=1 Tax=Sphingobacterium nematocida TaxID=1513896 RepID=A0A1T5CYI1_9SPHI|nr:DUF4998 domain-containing protein [Sphingobacterium nematocida]SKB64421.1 Beta-lactamase superfamily domain-containing protein [Sphingobacterium nematocida]
MNKIKYIITVVLFHMLLVGCDDANDLLNQHIKDGPIVYAGKIKEMATQSGYYRVRVNLFPTEDVNRAYCILSWNKSGESRDSVRVDYVASNYDKDMRCYYMLVDFPSIEGALQIDARNVDSFGNKSLLATVSTNIYGTKYVSALVNAPAKVSPRVDKVTFEERVGAVGNIISYEKNDGTFTKEIFVTDKIYPLVDAKRGGIVRTKTRFLINQTDIDTLDVTNFLETKIPTNEGIATMEAFRKTSPFLLNAERLTLLNKFESFSDSFPPALFSQYLKNSDDGSIDMEHATPILYAYRNAFDKVLAEVKSTPVENGAVAVWLLYNMGYIVKTPSTTFGVDVDHRWAEELEPYLDFLCVTHNHVDHAHTKLMDAMNKKSKPVLSNFYTKDTKYMSKVPKSYTIGDVKIRTDITDHLRDPALPAFVTVFRIECGANAGNFSMLHCGDSGFRPTEFKNVEGPLDLAILRWGAPRENDILGSGSGQVAPKYAILSHLIELRHEPYPKGQASITQTLKHLPDVKCDNTIIPFWGEKMIWKNGQMK